MIKILTRSTDPDNKEKVRILTNESWTENRWNKKALYILSVWVGFGWWESEDI
jgi:hypothetical protein